jgi:hypothetical protein
MEQIDPRIGTKCQPVHLMVLDTEQESAEITFDVDYCIFKIAPLTITGLAAAVTIELLVNGRPVFLNGSQILLTFPDEEFVWMCVLAGGARKISLRLSAVTTDDVEFVVTGYDPVVTR